MRLLPVNRAMLLGAVVLAGCSTSVDGEYVGQLAVVSEREDGPERREDEATVTVRPAGEARRYDVRLDGCSLQIELGDDEQATEPLLDGSCTCPGDDERVPVGSNTIDVRDGELSLQLLAARGSEPGCRYRFRGRRFD